MVTRQDHDFHDIAITSGATAGHWAAALGDDDRKTPRSRRVPARRSSPRPSRQTKRPNLYRVLILNDDYTPMEFVVHVLERFFNKDREAATRIMLHVHQHGIGECGVYHLRSGRNKSDAGDGLCPQTSPSSAMRDGKEVTESSDDRQNGRGGKEWDVRTANAKFLAQSRTIAPSRAALANERHHEYATLEHLLLALIDDPGRRRGDARLQRRSRQAAPQPRSLISNPNSTIWSPKAQRIPSRPPASSA